MAAGRRLFVVQERQRARHRRQDLDGDALEAAAQALFDSWPWLAEQYRSQNPGGEPAELPTAPLGCAIRRYLEHVGR